MPRFLALTSKGLQEALYTEMDELGLKRLKKEGSGVLFEGTWKDCYRANYELNIATRILLTILDFPAYKPDELYQNIMKHDFTKYIEPHQTLAIQAKVSESAFKDQRFVALKVKDAVVDQFRNKFGFRPNVDSKNPDLNIFVRAKKNQFSVSVDTSGPSLSYRGYRAETVEAPLREHLGAGLLKIMNWQPEDTLIDPFCGSGTFLIEAALNAKNIKVKRDFGFEKLKIFQKDTFDQVIQEQAQLHEESLNVPLDLYGFDRNNPALMSAQENAKKAKVLDWVKFKNRDFRNITPPCEKGSLIMNPPYGLRLDNVESLKIMYSDIASKMKSDFKGWDMWLLSGNPELSAALKLKADEKHFVYNGNLECRFLKYEIR